MSKIVDNLYVGSFADANDKKSLEKLGITHVVTAMETGKQIFDDMTYHIVQISDTYSANISVHFAETIEFIHKNRLAGNGVLVHW